MRLFSLLLLLAAPLAGAQDPLLSLLEFREQQQPLSMRFVQKLHAADGKVVERQEGRLELLPPDRFRWVYLSPYESEFGSDGKVAWHYEPDLNQIVLRDADAVIAGTPLALLLDTAQKLPLVASSDGWVNWVDEDNPDAQFAELRLRMVDEVPAVLELVDLLDQLTRVELSELRVPDQTVDPRYPELAPDVTIVDERPKR